MRWTEELIKECCSRRIDFCQCRSLFSHVVRLDNHTPAHTALKQEVAAHSGYSPSIIWHRRTGCPRQTWMQIGDSTKHSIRPEQFKADAHGQSCKSSQQTTAVYAGPEYGLGIVGKCQGPTTSKRPTKDGCKIFWTCITKSAINVLCTIYIIISTCTPQEN